MGAGEDLGERRLAGAVVAEQSHHLAGVHVEVDVRERPDRPEGLGHPADRDERLPGIARGERRLRRYRERSLPCHDLALLRRSLEANRPGEAPAALPPPIPSYLMIPALRQAAVYARVQMSAGL